MGDFSQRKYRDTAGSNSEKSEDEEVAEESCSTEETTSDSSTGESDESEEDHLAILKDRVESRVRDEQCRRETAYDEAAVFDADDES